MNCEHCGLEYEVTTTTSETGSISLRGIHEAGGVDCLTRQLAAKSAECEKLRDAIRETIDTLNLVDPGVYGDTIDMLAALLNEKGE